VSTADHDGRTVNPGDDAFAEAFDGGTAGMEPYVQLVPDPSSEHAAADTDEDGERVPLAVSSARMLAGSPGFSGFAVRELDAAKAFYGETLGLTVKDHPMGTLGITLGSGATVMVYHKPDFVPATYTILNFPVADVESTVDHLAAAGVRMQRYPGFDQDEKGISRGQGPTIAWFTDPSGNIIAVLEDGPTS